MLFRKKGTLRHKENEHLFAHIERIKRRYDNHQHVIGHSVEPSEDVLYQTKLSESLYTFLLREARARKAARNKL